MGARLRRCERVWANGFSKSTDAVMPPTQVMVKLMETDRQTHGDGTLSQLEFVQAVRDISHRQRQPLLVKFAGAFALVVVIVQAALNLQRALRPLGLADGPRAQLLPLEHLAAPPLRGQVELKKGLKFAQHRKQYPNTTSHISEDCKAPCPQ